VFIMVGAFVVRPRGVLDGHALGMNLRIVAASAVMIPVLLLAGSLPLVVQILLGVVTYAAASVLFRAISLSDVRRILDEVIGAVSHGRSPAVVGMPQPDLEADLAAEAVADAEVEAEIRSGANVDDAGGSAPHEYGDR